MITTPNAKINLGLRVCGLRPDGYHDIETVFLPYFGLCDSLEIVRGDDSDGKCMITIVREEGVDWEPQEDLCVKAYMALDADFSLPPVKIILEKRIPVGAGLGGGSSDGAFALRMLSEMFDLRLNAQQLKAYAARLGSDCAFFVENRPMFGEGRGEILTPLNIPQLESYEIQVVVPQDVRVNTAKAYKDIDGPLAIGGSSVVSGDAFGRGSMGASETHPLRSAVLRPIEEWKSLIVNDFEKPVFNQYPQLAAIKQSLYDSGAVYASMSGTGSALYGIYPK
ncbi:MAG: 4-(cytidine 5'-diphospho)-2-C-methyl-D-erythritol kinase [Bacteroidales bacterium]|nr:4-(cytidine 5'-diphospho)-2-C-methyl-D-erythritol kinase [Bacteroidales bacterium]